MYILSDTSCGFSLVYGFPRGLVRSLIIRFGSLWRAAYPVLMTRCDKWELRRKRVHQVMINHFTYLWFIVHWLTTRQISYKNAVYWDDVFLVSPLHLSLQVFCDSFLWFGPFKKVHDTTKSQTCRCAILFILAADTHFVLRRLFLFLCLQHDGLCTKYL